jgi:predicted secreted protein
MPATEKPFTGLTASVKVGPGASAKTLAYISGVDLNLDKEIIEILAFGMKYKEKVPAVKDWTASIDGTVALAAGGTQKQFYDAFESGDPLTIGIYLDDTTYFEGTGYVASFDISAAPDDKISLTSEISGSGATTLTLPNGGGGG